MTPTRTILALLLVSGGTAHAGETPAACPARTAPGATYVAGIDAYGRRVVSADAGPMIHVRLASEDFAPELSGDGSFLDRTLAVVTLEGLADAIEPPANCRRLR